MLVTPPRRRDSVSTIHAVSEAPRVHAGIVSSDFQAPASRSRVSHRSDSVCTVPTVFPPGPRQPTEIQQRFRDALTSVLRYLRPLGGTERAVSVALSSLRTHLERAVEDPMVTGMQIRATGVIHSFGTRDGDRSGMAAGTVSSLGIEVGLARGETILAEEITVLDLNGGEIPLSLDQRRQGLARGAYLVRDDGSGGSGGSGPATADETEAIRATRRRLRRISDGLIAHRRGDPAPLDSFIQAMEAGVPAPGHPIRFPRAATS